MTPDERAEMRRLVDAATPGPWEFDAHSNYIESGLKVVAYDVPDESGPYIAYAHPERMKRLLAYTERLEQENALVRDGLRELMTRRYRKGHPLLPDGALAADGLIVDTAWLADLRAFVDAIARRALTGEEPQS